MTFNATDMSTPVTRGELREELAQLETRFDHKLEQLETRFDHKLEQLETRFDHKLEQLETRLEQKLEQKLEEKLEQKLARYATKQDLEIWGGALLARIESSEQRILAELARYIKATEENLSIRISVIDEKYQDLPGRVGRLETRVFRSAKRQSAPK